MCAGLLDQQYIQCFVILQWMDIIVITVNQIVAYFITTFIYLFFCIFRTADGLRVPKGTIQQYNNTIVCIRLKFQFTFTKALKEML